MMDNVVLARQYLHDQVQADIDRFLARGGKVEQLPTFGGELNTRTDDFQRGYKNIKETK